MKRWVCLATLPIFFLAGCSVRPLQASTDLPAVTKSKSGIGSTVFSEPDGMTLLYIPAGEFVMGSDTGDEDQKPARIIDLDAYWIDQTEVTNKMYALCVAAGVCKEPVGKTSSTHASYYGNPDFENYPVLYIDWNMAKAYCEWVNRRLPTEAEWEKAARGPNANIYPWGDIFDGSLLNFCDRNCSFEWADKSFDDGFADVAPVGNYPLGKSIYGAYDMGGNVWEWASSLYRPYPYNAADGREDLVSTGSRVVRGGSWVNYIYSLTSASRYWNSQSDTYYHVGFRCAMNATP
jgi:serine/threonine-protein kinase